VQYKTRNNSSVEGVDSSMKAGALFGSTGSKAPIETGFALLLFLFGEHTYLTL
jgi:hypothetical protein